MNREKRLLYYKRDDFARFAREATQSAIRKGFVVREPCIACGNIKSTPHHWDYRKPFDVVWYCTEHHRKLHSNLRKGKINISYLLVPDSEGE